jgi:hypothetical protein
MVTADRGVVALSLAKVFAAVLTPLLRRPRSASHLNAYGPTAPLGALSTALLRQRTSADDHLAPLTGPRSGTGEDEAGVAGKPGGLDRRDQSQQGD